MESTSYKVMKYCVVFDDGVDALAEPMADSNAARSIYCKAMLILSIDFHGQSRRLELLKKRPSTSTFQNSRCLQNLLPRPLRGYIEFPPCRQKMYRLLP